MITKEKEGMSVGNGFRIFDHFYGLSTDTKPTDTANGSKFTEIDSGKEYMFDYEGSTWYEIPAASSGGGGGGSGGGGNIYYVTGTVDSDTCTLDKTAAEIEAALTDGAYAICKVANEDDGWDFWRLDSWYPYSEEYGYTYAFMSTYGTRFMFMANSGSDFPSAEYS